MASIVLALFEQTITSPDHNTGWLSLRISNEEFEVLQFAIFQTRNMARDLDTNYQKGWGEHT